MEQTQPTMQFIAMEDELVVLIQSELGTKKLLCYCIYTVRFQCVLIQAVFSLGLFSMPHDYTVCEGVISLNTNVERLNTKTVKDIMVTWLPLDLKKEK